MSVEKIGQDQRDAGNQVWQVNYNADGPNCNCRYKKRFRKISSILKEAKARRAMLLKYGPVALSNCPSFKRVQPAPN